MSDFLEELREANLNRQNEWPGYDPEKIGSLFRAAELAGEAGELVNAVKKLYRHENGIAGNKVSKDDLMVNLREEIGDVLISLDLLAIEYEIDLAECTIDKFNKTSNEVGLDTTLQTKETK